MYFVSGGMPFRQLLESRRVVSGKFKVELTIEQEKPDHVGGEWHISE